MKNKIKKFELVFADARGKVFNFPGLDAAGMAAGQFYLPKAEEYIPLPESSEIFLLPDRLPVGWDASNGGYTTLESDPYAETVERCFAVAAFIPPGYTLRYSAAYRESSCSAMLPLFAYGAISFAEGHFYIAALRVDKNMKHDERLMDMAQVRKNCTAYEKIFPKNRLIPHLAACATVNACANAKNFFLGRFEAPIPTSPVCNAQCQGCISFQPAGRIPSTQSRIQFVPSPEEIAEIALYHIGQEPSSIVSFGQGCEGEPTLSGETIEKAIRLIRQKTTDGTININTNASRPKVLERLFQAGLNSIRVSTNSVREPYYSRYYQPKGYSFAEVTESVDVAKKAGAFVSVNYLSMPGFTDSPDEFEAFSDFIGAHRVDMVQWRNLNYDPMYYFRDLKLENTATQALGMETIMRRLNHTYPRLEMGYFNPGKSLIAKALAR